MLVKIANRFHLSLFHSETRGALDSCHLWCKYCVTMQEALQQCLESPWASWHSPDLPRRAQKYRELRNCQISKQANHAERYHRAVECGDQRNIRGLCGTSKIPLPVDNRHWPGGAAMESLPTRLCAVIHHNSDDNRQHHGDNERLHLQTIANCAEFLHHFAGYGRLCRGHTRPAIERGAHDHRPLDIRHSSVQNVVDQRCALLHIVHPAPVRDCTGSFLGHHRSD